jgi:cell division protein FtsA
MARIITTGVDIGSYQTKIVIAERVLVNGKETVRILGTGRSESRGLRHGYVVHKSDTSRSVQVALAEAVRMAGVPVKRVFLGISGIGLQSSISVGGTVISRADAEITHLDLEKALDASQNSLPEYATVNRKVIHAIPLSYKIDGKIALGHPLGMKGMKLEVRALFVTCLEHHLNDLIEVVEEAGLEVIDVTPSPFAAALVMLSKAQRIAGCILANIGSETVSIAVYENNLPISVEVFPIGSNDITNDIALGLRIPLDEAEQVKLGSVVGGNYPKKKLDEIIAARLSDIFDLIESHLKKLGKSGLLPAGVILTGGGSSFATIEDFARSFLKLPARVGLLQFDKNRADQSNQNKIELKDSSWSVAYGLCMYGFSSGEEGPLPPRIGKGFIDLCKSITRWFKQFLP